MYNQNKKSSIIIKFSIEEIENLLSNIDKIKKIDDIDDKYLWIDNVFNFYFNKRNFCINNQFDPYLYVENLPIINQQTTSETKTQMIAYNDYVYEHYYKKSYFFNSEKDDRYNYLIYKEHFAPFRIKMYQNTTFLKWFFDKQLSNINNHLQTIFKEKIEQIYINANNSNNQLNRINRQQDSFYILITTHLNQENIATNCIFKIFYNKNQDIIGLNSIETKNFYWIDDATETNLNKFYDNLLAGYKDTLSLHIEECYHYWHFKDQIIKENLDFIPIVIESLNKNNAFLDYVVSYLLSMRDLTTSFDLLNSKIREHRYAKNYIPEETLLIREIFPAINHIYPFIRNNGMLEAESARKTFKNKILGIDEEQVIEQKPKTLVDSIIGWLQGSSKKEKTNDIVETAIQEPVFINNSSLLTVIYSNQYTDYFSREDLKNIELIHQYMQSCDNHELKTLYDLFLEQINNYMQLNSNQAKVYDFNKFIAKMKEKIDSFEENKTNELLDKLNTGFTILDKY